MSIQIISKNKTNNITYYSSGKWFDTNFNSGEYRVNLSDIFTTLIKEAALYCENYADDLFKLWQTVKEDLQDYHYSGKKYAFGFKAFGVDNAKQIMENYVNGRPNIYKAVWILSIEVECLLYCENRVKVTLEKIY